MKILAAAFLLIPTISILVWVNLRTRRKLSAEEQAKEDAEMQTFSL